ncbi:unnamed protein product [Cyprideis torosa]|uniref:Uncharacterized protein n=1 Tax=Cyprideis torosa TaxID=163714 RepID=A0A7R8ZLC0_9CRUS|nr:unnamed protein product [Cyprideis torosa]CAG0881945.1 unnamed protein product [Cyprideis torosa]
MPAEKKGPGSQASADGFTCSPSSSRLDTELDLHSSEAKDTSSSENENDSSDQSSDEGSDDDEGSSSSGTEDGNQDIPRCAICLRKLTDQLLGSPEGCDHTFCLMCIEEWSKNVNTCPVDRATFNLILVRRGKEPEKVIRRISVEEQRELAAADEAQDVLDLTYCEICGRSDNEHELLLCDSCDLGYHLYCLTPALPAVPDADWFCPECTMSSARSLAVETGISEAQALSILQESVASSLPPGTGNGITVPSQGTRARRPRTQQTERIRITIERRRRRLAEQEEELHAEGGEEDEESSESSFDEEEEEEAEADVEEGSAAQATPKTVRKTRRRKTKSKRKKTVRKPKSGKATTRRKKRKSTTKAKTTTRKRKIGRGKKRKTTGRRRKGKGRKRSSVRRGRVSKTLTSVTQSIRCRLAESLGLRKTARGSLRSPQIRGAALPYLHSTTFTPGGVAPEWSGRTFGGTASVLRGLRNSAGIPTLKLFGGRDDMDMSDDDLGYEARSYYEQQAGRGLGGGGVLAATSSAARTARTSPPKVTNFDLVGSILDLQTIWHSDQSPAVTVDSSGNIKPLRRGPLSLSPSDGGSARQSPGSSSPGRSSGSVGSPSRSNSNPSSSSPTKDVVEGESHLPMKPSSPTGAGSSGLANVSSGGSESNDNVTAQEEVDLYSDIEDAPRKDETTSEDDDEDDEEAHGDVISDLLRQGKAAERGIVEEPCAAAGPAAVGDLEKSSDEESENLMVIDLTPPPEKESPPTPPEEPDPNPPPSEVKVEAGGSGGAASPSPQEDRARPRFRDGLSPPPRLVGGANDELVPPPHYDGDVTPPPEDTRPAAPPEPLTPPADDINEQISSPEAPVEEGEAVVVDEAEGRSPEEEVKPSRKAEDGNTSPRLPPELETIDSPERETAETPIPQSKPLFPIIDNASGEGEMVGSSFRQHWPTLQEKLDAIMSGKDSAASPQQNDQKRRNESPTRRSPHLSPPGETEVISETEENLPEDGEIVDDEMFDQRDRQEHLSEVTEEVVDTLPHRTMPSVIGTIHCQEPPQPPLSSLLSEAAFIPNGRSPPPPPSELPSLLSLPMPPSLETSDRSRRKRKRLWKRSEESEDSDAENRRKRRTSTGEEGSRGRKLLREIPRTPPPVNSPPFDHPHRGSEEIPEKQPPGFEAEEEANPSWKGLSRANRKRTYRRGSLSGSDKGNRRSRGSSPTEKRPQGKRRDKKARGSVERYDVRHAVDTVRSSTRYSPFGKPRFPLAENRSPSPSRGGKRRRHRSSGSISRGHHHLRSRSSGSPRRNRDRRSRSKKRRRQDRSLSPSRKKDKRQRSRSGSPERRRKSLRRRSSSPDHHRKARRRTPSPHDSRHHRRNRKKAKSRRSYSPRSREAFLMDDEDSISDLSLSLSPVFPPTSFVLRPPRRRQVAYSPSSPEPYASPDRPPRSKSRNYWSPDRMGARDKTGDERDVSPPLHPRATRIVAPTSSVKKKEKKKKKKAAAGGPSTREQAGGKGNLRRKAKKKSPSPRPRPRRDRSRSGSPKRKDTRKHDEPKKPDHGSKPRPVEVVTVSDSSSVHSDEVQVIGQTSPRSRSRSRSPSKERRKEPVKFSFIRKSRAAAKRDSLRAGNAFSRLSSDDSRSRSRSRPRSYSRGGSRSRSRSRSRSKSWSSTPSPPRRTRSRSPSPGTSTPQPQPAQVVPTTEQEAEQTSERLRPKSPAAEQYDPFHSSPSSTSSPRPPDGGEVPPGTPSSAGTPVTDEPSKQRSPSPLSSSRSRGLPQSIPSHQPLSVPVSSLPPPSQSPLNEISLSSGKEKTPPSVAIPALQSPPPCSSSASISLSSASTASRLNSLLMATATSCTTVVSPSTSLQRDLSSFLASSAPATLFTSAAPGPIQTLAPSFSSSSVTSIPLLTPPSQQPPPPATTTTIPSLDDLISSIISKPPPVLPSSRSTTSLFPAPSKKSASAIAASSSPYSPQSPQSDEMEGLFDPPPDKPPSTAKRKRPSQAAVGSPQEPFPPSSKETAASRAKKVNKFDILFGGIFPTGKSNQKPSKSKGKSRTNQAAPQTNNNGAEEDIPGSAVELMNSEKLLSKLNRQERAADEVKMILKPYFHRREITKEIYKEVMRRSVPKICHSKSKEINPIKIRTLVEGYIKKVRHEVKHQKVPQPSTGARASKRSVRRARASATGGV